MRIFISDSVNFGNHAELIKDAINIGYGSDLSDEIFIKYNNDSFVSTIRSDIATAFNEGYECFIQSMRGIEGWAENYTKTPYLQSNGTFITFMPLGINLFIELTGGMSDTPQYLTHVVTSGSGDIQNRTAYGQALEFWDDDTITPGTFESSFSNGVVLGKLLKIKDTLNCDWWTARYLARLTADRNEPNRETEPWDLRNGFGKINIQAAIDAYGTVVIPEDPYLPPQLGEAGESSFVVYPDKILLSWESVVNAEGYKVYRKYRNEAEELIATTEELFYEDVPTRHPFPIQYRVVAYLDDQSLEILNREILFSVVGKVMVMGINA